jgi:hypothetical protein
VEFTREIGDATLQTVHDYAAAVPRTGAGVAWHGFRSWLRRPPISSVIPGLFVAGPFSRGGNSPSATVLSAALASYGGHDYLN